MKISSYSNVAVPELNDRLVGTSTNADPIDSTYNFTLAELLELFQNNLNSPAIVIDNVPVYEDNAEALADGLFSGNIYRTGDVLKIVH